jgi:adenine-specific DNA glycosylase
VREALLSWFEENARDLPWRRTRDPWRILVSEVMLQQIQVKRAIPFYERFLGRFPTVEALAEAPLSDAIRVWGDLGRYRRVVNLHRTARIVVDDHGGKIPSDNRTVRPRHERGEHLPLPALRVGHQSCSPVVALPISGPQPQENLAAVSEPHSLRAT